MQRILRFLLLASFAVAISSSGQTLADAARAQQAKKKTPTATGHVYTNESMEFHAAPADATPAKSDTAASSDAATDKKADAKAKDGSAGDDASAEDKQKAAAAMKDKVAKATAEIAQLQRELDILVRENRIRAAVYYADAGSRLRDEAKFAADDRKYQADIAAKQKAIADAQAALEKAREEARRAGINVS